ncbi:MFS general substrate transporter [Suillus bovinus]|uniref:MFS general substrate transporter n=1 Tax=Suillus bovinus TaxID=48563 RepID=UPI001B872AEE|nr:MFS general substrate transporter [Suillus bovinus]KAG2150668.1 MFS general substrate transporter [Suillus bovinus]
MSYCHPGPGVRQYRMQIIWQEILAMSEKSLSIEPLQVIDCASEISHVLSYDRQKTEEEEEVVVEPEILYEEVSQKHVTHLGEAPDGGLRAWLVVFRLIDYVLYIFQAYYEENLLVDTSPSTIAWIGSTQYALLCFPSLATGRMFDLGYFKIPFFAASCVIVACTFLTAECTQFWQLFLTQGVGLGASYGFLYVPTVVIVSQWFSKRRGLALSLTTVGTALGSILFPVVAQNLIPLIGFKWTVRVFGFILMATLGTANVLLKRRLPPVNVRGGLFNLKAFRNKAFTIYCISGIVILLGLYTELTYLSVSAVAIGISRDFSFYILAIANAASALRVSFGLMSDRVGAINTMAVLTAITGIATIAWPFAENEVQFISIAIIYGSSLGAYVCLYSAPLVAMGQIEDAGRRVGMFLSLLAFGGVAGPPISGAISTTTGGFAAAGYYSGGIVLFGVAILLVARYLHLGRLWGKF